MKYAKTLFLAALAVATFSGCKEDVSGIAVVPNPVSKEAKCCSVSMHKDAAISAKGENLEAVAATFRESVGELALPKIALAVDGNLAEEEYVLETRCGKVAVTGGSAKGVWWGLQTLLQIAQQRQDGKFPGIVIKDKPAFEYRGAHLDCCRHFFSKDDVKTFIDICAIHKINTFHWHLTEDQGWRIEIKKYPKLTEFGSVRKETKAGHQRDKDKGYDGTPYGGFYTQEEMKEVVAYAAARQITVVPEVEMPGHALAALASYPELGCTGKGYEVSPDWGVFPDIFCAGKESTFEFLQDVLDEVCEIFPSEFIHIGGDEAPRARWAECPDCQARIKAEGLKDEAQLQSYLVNRIEKYLNSKGRKVIGWDEILEGGISQSATVMSWRGAKGGIAAAKLGNDVIMTPNSHFYLDYYQTEKRMENGEPLAIGGYLPLSKCYSFDPFDQLDEDEKVHIKGIQANVWTEYITSFDHVMHMTLPRLAALAEVSWSNGNRTEYGNFVERIENALLPIYESRGYSYSDYAFKGIE